MGLLRPQNLEKQRLAAWGDGDVRHISRAMPVVTILHPRKSPSGLAFQD